MARVYDTCLVLCSFVMCVLMRMRKDVTGDKWGVGVGGGCVDTSGSTARGRCESNKIHT